MINIEKNYIEYKDLLRSTEKNGIEKLINWLDTTDAKIAPTSTQYHLSIPGGWVQHSLNVYYRLKKLIADEGLSDRYPDSVIILVALCHDLCKINYYTKYLKSVLQKDANGNQVKKPNGTDAWEQVESYKIRDDKMVYGLHGENSVFILSKMVPSTTYEEMLAIRWHMGCLDWQDNQTHVGTMSEAFAKSPLAMLLHFADAMASTFDETKTDNVVKSINLEIKEPLPTI